MGEQIANTSATPTPSTFPAVAPTPGIGAPDGRLGIQDQVTEIGQSAAAFHNGPLLLMCVIISLFVLVLLAYTMFKYRRGANPTPSRNSHNTVLEVVWTLVPVLVLVAIAIPSIRLLAAQYSPPPADLTIKVVGHQWNWTYQYPDNGGVEIVSNMLKEKGDPSLKPGERFRTDADGPPLLAVDERLVIPAGKVVKFLITSEDVIHSFAVPAFWTKMDANPGRINQDWVKVDRSEASISANARNCAALATATCQSRWKCCPKPSSTPGSPRRAAPPGAPNRRCQSRRRPSARPQRPLRPARRPRLAPMPRSNNLP